MKTIFYLSILFCSIGLIFAFPGGGFFSHIFGFLHFRTPESICTNATVATDYLLQILTLTANLQANSTYSAVFESTSPNLIAFLRNTTNQALIPNECTTFVAGLKTARLADKAARSTRKQIGYEIHRQFEQVLYNVMGNTHSNELDSNDEWMYD